eukprot:jgi/Mesvir1/13092/Mv06074-RA.3
MLTSSGLYAAHGRSMPVQPPSLCTILDAECRESGDASKRRPYLPPDKQYLLTRNVPCQRRATSLEEDYAAAGGERLVLGDTALSEGGVDRGSGAGGGGGGDPDEGWLVTHAATVSGAHGDDSIPDMDADACVAPERQGAAAVGGGSSGGPAGDGDHGQLAAAAATASSVVATPPVDDDDVPDMDDFDGVDNLVAAEEQDEAALKPWEVAAASSAAMTDDKETNILRTRTYDVSITYDKYYQTPRVWLFGYDEERNPLTPEQTFEDVSQDHAHKTVTMEQHPHLPYTQASVHPCRHADVMKRIVAVLSSSGADPSVDHYLLIFLKFISSVIPTIEYDYTFDVDVGTNGIRRKA